MEQLEVFHRASYKVSRDDKATRMFYLERAVREVLSERLSDFGIFENAQNLTALQVGAPLNWRPRFLPSSRGVHPIQYH